MVTDSIIKERIKKPLNEDGFTLVNAFYKKEGHDLYLHIIIDMEKDIGLDDIVKATNIISPLLEQIEGIDERYILDVSTLGAEREIDVHELEKYVNKHINVHLINPIDGENYLQGDLLEVSEEMVKLSFRVKTRTKTVEIVRSNIDKARLAIKF